MPLEQELATYQANLAELKVHEGKFVLIKGDKVVDVFAAYEDAIKHGYQEFGLEPFLVKQIRAVEQLHFVTRLIVPGTVETPL